MVSTDEIKQRIEAGLPDASAEVSGDGQHFRAEVVSPAFAGLSRIQQHKLVYEALDEPWKDGSIHELRIKTKGTQS